MVRLPSLQFNGENILPAICPVVFLHSGSRNQDFTNITGNAELSIVRYALPSMTHLQHQLVSIKLQGDNNGG